MDALGGDAAREDVGRETDLTLSRLDLAGELGRSLGVSAGAVWIADVLRFQNDRRPPVGFFSFDSSTVLGRSSFSRTLHPTRAVSETISCIVLMDFCHSKEPLEASKRERGLLADADR